MGGWMHIICTWINLHFDMYLLLIDKQRHKIMFTVINMFIMHLVNIFSAKLYFSFTAVVDILHWIPTA